MTRISDAVSFVEEVLSENDIKLNRILDAKVSDEESYTELKSKEDTITMTVQILVSPLHEEGTIP